MIDSLLHARLRPLLKRWRRFSLWRALAVLWLAAAALAWGCSLLRRAGENIPASSLVWILALALAGSLAAWAFFRSAKPAPRRLAAALEARYPDLNGRLLTAIQQEPNAQGAYHFLQERLFEDAVRHSIDHNWGAVRPVSWITTARCAAWAGALLLAASFWVSPPAARPVLASMTGGETTPDGVTVTPGDASIERGSSFTVMARFDQAVPATAEMIVGEAAASERAIPLVKSMADPVFGGTLNEVADSFTYRIAYHGKRTRDFKVTVFEYPRLERSDIDLTYPAYTQLAPRRIEDSRRASAVEGTTLALSLQLNKPVASATLVPKKDKKDEAASAAKPIPLRVDPARAVATLADFPLTISQSYELRLVDAEGRPNKTPDIFVFNALPNRAPELKLAAPRGDIHPSPLEEIVFNGTAWDDFGVLAYGLAFTKGGEAAQFIELGADVPAEQRQAFQHMLKLEALNAKPDELYSWFVWADDIGPDGQRRRTQGDLFFAEVRPFEEIFREGEGMEGGQQQQQQGQQGGGSATQLVELQKQIINATWKLQRGQPAAPTYASDAGVVRDSQADALSQAKEAAAETEEPMRAALWQAVTGQMEQAEQKLSAAPQQPAVLPDALAAEQSAYQALLKLRERENQVTRSQNSQGQASSGQQRQNQIDELELQQAENRYETQRQAQQQQSAERREEMQVQNRLRELAERQEDVNEKLKELQAALQAAPDQQQEEELRRQLKRLEEEQRQMLADMDELRQRMDSQENQSRMAQQRQQMEQTRQDAQNAAEAASRGEVSQALASGARAQQQLQEMREQMRRESAGEFAEELREMRTEARDLAQRQQEITEQLQAGGEEQAMPRQSLSGTPGQEPQLQELARQQERTADLVQRATELSQEAEAAEPLVSRNLYEGLREFSQADAGGIKQMRQDLMREGSMTQRLYDEMQRMQENPAPGQSLSLASELLRADLNEPAQRASQQAQAGLDRLKTGVEKAAEKILGNDTAALELAEKELEALAEELRREVADAQQQGAGDGANSADQTNPSDQADPRSGSQPGQNRGQTAQNQPNENSHRPGNQQDEGKPGETQTAENQSAGGQQSQNQQGESQTAQNQRPGTQSGQESGQNGESESPGQAGQVAQNDSNEGEPGSSQESEASQPGENAPSGQENSPQTASNSQQPGQGRSPGQNQEGRQAGFPGGSESEDEGGSGGDSANDRVARLFGNDSNEPSSREGRGGGGGARAPLYGEDFTEWSDRLREVEEMIEYSDLRNGVATARERARALRQEARRDLKKPDWAVVELEILRPLVEVRQQVREELRRRSADEKIAPIDRDPVPERYADLVRRYYEELGKDN